MNKVILVGRLARDPEVRYTSSQSPLCIASYTLAVDNRKGEADFIKCKAFAKAGEFAEKYFKKGMRVSISGRLQTGSYTNREGVKINTTEIIIEEQEFAQSKKEAQEEVREILEFRGIDDILQEELPFV